MKNKIILTYMLFFIGVIAYGQNPIVNDPILSVYKILSSESVKVKDSLAIYALNFELSIAKKNKGTIITKIAANDSLAFSLFPSYKKFSTIDFSPIMGAKTRVKLIIPILIYGSSPEKMLHQDKYGRPLIDLEAALSAAYALYRPFEYNNLKDSREGLGYSQRKSSKNEKSKLSYWDAITIDPLIHVIYNIK